MMLRSMSAENSQKTVRKQSENSQKTVRKQSENSQSRGIAEGRSLKKNICSRRQQ